MADDNKPLKYMRYAIGEIVLVVIGILIALQINTWNEERKESIIERLYLERLLDDLKIDIKYYDERISYFKMSIEHFNQYLQESYEVQHGPENVRQLFTHLYLQTDPLATENSTYRELNSTGKLNVFKNELLRKNIIDYYRINEDLEKQIDEFNLVSTELLVQSMRVVTSFMKLFPYTNHILDTNKYVVEDWSFINDPSSVKFQTIETMVLTYSLRNGEHLGFVDELKVISTKLDSLITEELKKID